MANRTDRRGHGPPKTLDARLEVRVARADLDRWRDAADTDDRRTLADWLRWLAAERVRKLGK